MKNIVAATFQPGYTTAKVLGLWQYDYGQILRIQGLELPDAVEIHFSLQEKGGESERQVGLTRDGVTEVAVPNSYLENAGKSRDYSIYAFLYISDGKSGNTEYKITMYVQSRPKPNDPETPEDPKDDPFGKTIEAVNKAMESTKASAEVAADSAKSASESATRAEKSAVESQKSAKAAATSEKAAATSATAAAQSASQSRESATAAQTAADQAGKSATSAAESANTATQQAENAAQSATNAARSAESAVQSAEAAKTAADTAEKSASAAQQASRSAAESASTASTAAQTATTAAGKTAESATSAARSAEEAGQKAAAAETAASKAAESAAEAAKSATAAEDSASAAKTSETAAEEAAQTAQEQAEKIVESAEQIEKNKAGVAAIIIEESATGSNIVITDSAKMPLRGLNLFGKSTQVTTTGKNLIDFPDLIASQANYPVTVTDPNTLKSANALPRNVQLCVSGIYSSDSTENIHKWMWFYIGNDVAGKFEINGPSSVIPEGDITAIYVYFGTGAKNVSLTNVQVEEGTAATSYEPYTDGKPSPSPDFPQEIISAGDSGKIEIDVTGKNLISTTNLTQRVNEPYLNNSKRCIKPGEYIIGLTANNYVRSDTITDAKIEVNKIKFSNSSGGYGIGIGVSLKPGKRYKGAFSELNDKGLLYLVFYTEDGTYINNCDAKSFQVPINALYTVAIFRDRYGPNSFEFQDFIIVETDDTTYEPYHDPQTIDFTTLNGLPGIPVESGGNYTDENGQQWVCDEVDFERGVYIQRVWRGEFDGSDDEWWTRYDTSGYQGFSANLLPETMYRRNGFANYYAVGNGNHSSTEALWLGVGNTRIYVHNSRFYDAELGDKGLSNFKAYLAEHPLIVVTYLDAPIETPLTADQIAAYKTLTTHKATTLISNDAGAGMEVSYVADPKTYIDNKFAELSQAIVASASEAE